MNNKAFSMKSVFSYVYSPFYKGFSQAMLLLVGILIAFGFAQHEASTLTDIASQTLPGLPLFVQVGGVGFFALGFAVFSFIISVVQFNLALMIYDEKTVDISTIIPSFAIISGYFRAAILFVVTVVGYTVAVVFPVALLVSAFPVLALVFLILSILPLIYLMLRLSMFSFSALEGYSGMAALNNSWRITEGKLWIIIRSSLVLLASVFPALVIAGLTKLLFTSSIAVFIKIVSMPILFGLPQTLLYVYLYRQLSAEKAAQ